MSHISRLAAVVVAMVILVPSARCDHNTVKPEGGSGGSEQCANVNIRSLSMTIQLNNGVSIPRIGFGTAGLGDATEGAVWLALMVGYRHIDSAQAQEWYREDAVGRALERAGLSPPPIDQVARATEHVMSEGGKATEENGPYGASVSGSGTVAGIPATPSFSRDGVFVTTKIHPRDFQLDRLRKSVDASRRNLNGVDLLLLHSPTCWPGSCRDSPTPWQAAWRGMEVLYAEGIVRAIGVSNFSESLLRELLGMAKVKPAVVQNWMDPFHQDKAVRSLCTRNAILEGTKRILKAALPQTFLSQPHWSRLSVHKFAGVAYVAYSTLGGQWTYRSSPPPPNPVSTDATLRSIAEAHQTSPQAVAMSWALQSGAVILPRSSDSNRIRENLQSFVGQEETNGCPVDEASRGEERGESTGAGTPGTAHDGNQVISGILSPEEMVMINGLDGILGG